MSSNNYQELENIQRQKINKFCSKIGDGTIERAERYLIAANWDENLAVQNFMNTHPNYIPPNQINYNFQPPQFNSNFQQQFAPSTQINQRYRSQISNENRNNQRNVANYLEFNIGQSLINRSNNEQSSNTLNYLRSNCKSMEKNFGNFLKVIKQRSGVVIIVNENNSKIKEQIRLINSNLPHNCVIFPVINNSSIGNEFVQQLSIVSFPTYIFCKYKDGNNFYITDRMEGAFDISFFNDSISRNIPESNKNLNLNNSKNNNIKKNENNNNKKEGSKNLIKELKKDKYFSLPNQNRNLRNNQKNAGIQNKNNNQNNNNLENNKKDQPNIQNNLQYNGNIMGDIYLGDSREIPNLFNNDRNNNQMNYNNQNNNYPSYFNNNINNYNPNNYYNPIPNYNYNYFFSDINNNNNNNNYNNNSNRNNDSNRNNNKKDKSDDKNILTDSLYGLSDGQIYQKRENDMRKLEEEHEKKLKKEEEEEKKRLKIEEEEKEKRMKYEVEAEIEKMNLSEEPDESDPNTCHIKFRIPSGEKTIERRFLKTDKIDILFRFVKSKGAEIFTEPDSNDFTIISVGFPRKNLVDKKNNTLEQEGLFPNSLLQIEENKSKSK